MGRSLMPELPAWAVDIIEARAQATGMSYDEALLASLDMRALDPQAESLGWAVAHGERAKDVARRTHYARSTVEAATTRYRRRER
ncbi:helix-turn-helix DNA binding domain protein [Microbacterium phage Teamocil]|uniref:Helix-turn-helix DNA binding domain protein n=1 Tax=Microbacterium phage Teamocil TaxID=2656554 RepID=A0A649VYB2_9CAUD|nr:helix-turn-helix DNA binding domain protein [Microbacterium phage Teamocil]QGJ88908.1 helix-turn-helix DNA binding domain protein [Microbacterium phage Gina]QGJ97005.1 helix-turn-helix DNA binding domain protein [Microbacterium phage Teamocil]